MIRRLLALRHHRFVRDTLVMQASGLVQAATYLGTSVMTARALRVQIGPETFDPSEMGRWSTSLELYMFMYFLMNMGLARAAVSLYSEAMGRGDRPAMVNALAALLKLGTCMCAAIVVLGQFAPRWAEAYYGDREVGEFASILCFASLAEVVRALTFAALTGSRQMKRYAAFDMTANVLRVALLAAALLWRPAVSSVVYAYVAHAAVVCALALRAYLGARSGDPKLAPPALRELVAAIPSAPLRQFFGLSYMLALGKSMYMVVTRLGILIIPGLGVMLASGEGMAEGAAYKIGYVLSLVMQIAVSAIPQTLLPTLGLKMGRSDVPIDRLGDTLRKVSLVSGGLTALATVLSVPFMWLVVTYGYGSGYEGAFDYYCLLAVGNLFVGFAVVTDPFYIYAGRLRASVIQNLCYSVVVLAGMALGTHLGGPKGLAAATGLGRIVVLAHLVYIWIYFRRVRAKNGLVPDVSEPDGVRSPTDAPGPH